MPSTATPQTAFYKSWVKIGGVFYPMFPNTVNISCPKNYILPPLIGNFWQHNYGEGLRQPVLSCQIAIRDIATEVLSATFLNYWMARTNDVAHDTTAISGGIEIWNGRRGFKMGTGCKADSFTIGSSAGDPLRFTARFCGNDFAPFSGLEATAALTAFTGWSAANLLSFSAIEFDEPLHKAVWNFNLSFANNHGIDASHNGTAFPTAQNAGMQTAGFNMLVQAATTPEIVLPLGNGSFPSPAVPSTIAFHINAPSGTTRTFTLNNPIINNPDDINIQAPRNMQEYSLTCLGGDGVLLPPLTIT